VITSVEHDVRCRKFFSSIAFTQMTATRRGGHWKNPRNFTRAAHGPPPLLGRIRQNLEQARTLPAKAINYRKDGTAFDVESDVAPIPMQRKKSRTPCTSSTTFTERKQTETALRESESRYRGRCLTAAPTASLMPTLKPKNLKYANSAPCRMFG